ncbi:hypothetical protein D4764_05G0011270 [Takifugu flavidus]|uniref:Alkylated DNA repair protein AlkB homologue 8 N-terminal domain-containing protein n=1 Tax=Takifugu flavidus TaxID=433684 RepID=A0A5C6N5U0_9TELE|nr:hypothetical protein D4764_05G0011270 [Takifugu flavidus]
MPLPFQSSHFLIEVNILGTDVDVVESYKYLGVHLNNNLDWTHNTDALVKKGNSRLFLLRRLRSFGVQGPLLRTFYDSVVGSAIFYGIVCWSSSITDRDRKRMDRLVRRASSVLGCPLDSVEVVGNGRMMVKLSSMLKNTSHPLQDTLTALGSSFSERLLHPRCVKERYRRSFLPAATEFVIPDEEEFLNFHPSIHPSILYHLSGVGLRGHQPKKRSPDFPLPSYFFQLIRGDPQAFPGQSRDIVSPTCPGSSRGSPTRGTCPEHLTREAPRVGVHVILKLQTGLDMYWLKQGDTSGTAGFESLAAACVTDGGLCYFGPSSLQQILISLLPLPQPPTSTSNTFSHLYFSLFPRHSLHTRCHQQVDLLMGERLHLHALHLGLANTYLSVDEIGNDKENLPINAIEQNPDDPEAEDQLVCHF